MTNLLILAARRVVAEKRKAWELEVLAAEGALKYAVDHHEVLTDHYWQPLHKAQEQYKASVEILEAIEAELKESS